jgi:hypothetical protein
METAENALNQLKNDGKATLGNQKALTHGLNPLKRAVYTLGNRAIDKRTSAGRALIEWRENLIRDLGGNVSTQQDAVISLAVKTKLLLDSVDVWLLEQPTLIIEKRKAIIPVVRERQVLADALARYLSMLGLERRQKVVSLEEILSKPDDTANGNGEVKS